MTSSLCYLERSGRKDCLISWVSFLSSILISFRCDRGGAMGRRREEASCSVMGLRSWFKVLTSRGGLFLALLATLPTPPRSLDIRASFRYLASVSCLISSKRLWFMALMALFICAPRPWPMRAAPLSGSRLALAGVAPPLAADLMEPSTLSFAIEPRCPGFSEALLPSCSPLPRPVRGVCWTLLSASSAISW